MKFAHITPSEHLADLDRYSDIYLLLSHLIPGNKKYTEFFAESKTYKILDNGAYELGRAEAIQELIRKAELVKANEIVLPDVFKDMEWTKKHTESAVQYLRESGLTNEYAYMGVPQGKTAKQYMDCLKWMINIPDIDIIGLSFIVIKDAFRDYTGIDEVAPNRILVTNILDQWDRKGKQFHLLGMGNCKELDFQKRFDWIRSADSSTAFVNGMNGNLFDAEKGMLNKRIEKPKDYFACKVDMDTLDKVYHNMEVIDGFKRIYGG